MARRALHSSNQHLLMVFGLKDIWLALTRVRAFSALALAWWNELQLEIRACRIFYSVTEPATQSSSARPLIVHFPSGPVLLQRWSVADLGILIVSFCHLFEMLFLSMGLDVCVYYINFKGF